jgi:hypothetical protein
METLTTLLKRWPQLAQVDESDGRLRLVVEDPFVRDLLRKPGLRDRDPARHLVRDRDRLAALERLRVAAGVRAPAAEAEEVATDVGAAIRRDLAGEAAALAEFDKAMKKWEKRTPQERPSGC